MSWTALVAEYLVIGLQCIVWMGLLFLRCSGVSTSVVSSVFSAKAAHLAMPMTFVVLVASYSIGMLFDKLFHIITEPFLKKRVRRLWKKFYVQTQSSNIGALFYSAEDFLFRPEGREARLYRRRGRIRVLRAGLFNIPLLALGVILNSQGRDDLWFPAIALSVMLWIGTIIAFAAVHKEYVHMIARAARSVPTGTAGVAA